MIAPDVLPAIVGRPGMVWTPINSPLYRYGDSYYYAAWVAEIIRNGVPPHSPSAAELSGKPILETIRWFPLWVAALPGYIVSDFRVVYVVDYAFTALVLFSVPFAITWSHTRSAAGAVIVGIFVLFLAGHWWVRLPVAPGFGAPADVLAWLSQCYDILTHYSFASFFDIYEYEADPGTFRFINNSVSAPIQLLYLYGCFSLYRETRYFWLIWLAVAISSPLFAFFYPSRTLIAFLLLVGFGALAAIEGRKKPALALFSICVASILMLLAGGYVGYVRQVFAENELWNNIFQNEKIELVNRPLGQALLIVFVNKYFITYVVSLLIVWRDRELRALIGVVGLIASGAACVGLFNTPLLWDRFLGRGIDHTWLACFPIAFVLLFSRLGKRMSGDGRSILVWRTLAAVVVIGVLLIPLKGFGEYAIASSKNLTRFMPAGRWEALRWVDANVQSNDTVAALNWDDITFVPIYTRAKLAVDNLIVGGRSPSNEMMRYAAVAKIIGLSEEAFRARLENSTRAASARLSLNARQLRAPPLSPSEEEYAAGQIAEAVIYWPYIATVDGVAVADSAGVPTEGFIRWAMSMYEQSEPLRATRDLKIKYIVVSGAELSSTTTPRVPADLVYENVTHRIYRLREMPE
ncbi:hypothetical protein AB8B21_05845 [Tardiphaga sp. 866_E4_N2_1]|uniref:hypothetical protein n=1 Tax=unclassified Tardiphaga TaxID=2631404 RepID=UPI003F26B0FD